MSELVLGIDIGTSSSKGVLAQLDGTIVAIAERPHPLSLPRPGWAEHDAEATWWGDFRALYDTLYATYRSPYPATREAMHTLADIQLGSAPRNE